MTSVVHFIVFDETGERPYKITRFADSQSGRDLTKLFNGLEAKNLPYGQYEYVLDRIDIKNPKLSTIRGRLYVYQPEHWLELNPSGRYESGSSGEVIQEFDEQQDSPIVGTLVPAPQHQGLVWVRIEAVHSRDRVAAGVDAKGAFRVYARLWGWYVVMVLNQGKLVHAEPLYVDLEKKLNKLVIHWAGQ